MVLMRIKRERTKLFKFMLTGAVGQNNKTQQWEVT